MPSHAVVVLDLPSDQSLQLPDVRRFVKQSLVLPFETTVLTSSLGSPIARPVLQHIAYCKDTLGVLLIWWTSSLLCTIAIFDESSKGPRDFAILGSKVARVDGLHV